MQQTKHLVKNTKGPSRWPMFNQIEYNQSLLIVFINHFLIELITCNNLLDIGTYMLSG
jgi:hypothetical protein